MIKDVPMDNVTDRVMEVFEMLRMKVSKTTTADKSDRVAALLTQAFFSAEIAMKIQNAAK